MKNLLKITSIIILISLFGCKKEIENNNGNPTMEPSLLNLSNLPTVNGDRLQFNSWSQYEDFIEDVEYELDLPTTTDIDSTLFQIEQNEFGGFFSLRQKMNIDNRTTTDGNWIDTSAVFFSEEIDTMFSCDYIGDDIEKSILNEYAELQINDTVYIFFSANITLKIHESESSIINLIRDIEKCKDTFLPIMTDSRIIIKSGIYDKDNDYPESCIVVVDKSDTPGTTILYKYFPKPILKKLNCRPSVATFSFHLSQVKEVNGDRHVGTPVNFLTLRINWGDGLIENKTNVTSGSSFEHDYLVYNTFYMEMTGTFKDIDGNIKTISDGCFIKSFSSKINVQCRALTDHWDGHVKNNFWKMSYYYKISTDKGKGGKIIGWSKSWKKKNGGWKQRRKKMETYIQAKFRGPLDNCGIIEQPSRIKNKKRRKVRVRSKRNDQYFYSLLDGDCYSTHEMVNENLNASIYATICN